MHGDAGSAVEISIAAASSLALRGENQMHTGNGFENLGIGVGLRSRHYAHILEQQPDVDWFEVLSDNYMHTAGRPLYFLDRIAERYPVVLHGVGLSIGSTG